MEDFDAKLESFIKGCNKIYADYMARNFSTLPVHEITSTRGGRYVRLVRENSVHCFVDMTNGDVLKAAGWKTPAKHARGNIFDEHNGLKLMGEYGPAYLR